MKKKLIIIIPIAVLVIAFLVTGFATNWFSGKGRIDVDYSHIEVDSSDVEVTNEEIEAVIEQTLKEEAGTAALQEGDVLEYGDDIILTFSGVLEGEGEPFDGGTAEGYALTLGSGTMIDGFESSIVGHRLGEVFDINLTFPDDYNEELSGKKVIFTIKVTGGTRKVYPEFTDDFVKYYSEKYLAKQLNTTEEFREFIKDNFYESRLHDAMFTYLYENSTVVKYDKAILKQAKAYVEEGIKSYMVDNDIENEAEIAVDGYDSVEDYVKESSEKYAKQIMLVEKIFTEQGLEFDQALYEEELYRYIISYGYNDMTVKEYEDLAGENWVWIYKELGYKFSRAMEAIEGNVNFTEETYPVPDVAE